MEHVIEHQSVYKQHLLHLFLNQVTLLLYVVGCFESLYGAPTCLLALDSAPSPGFLTCAVLFG